MLECHLSRKTARMYPGLAEHNSHQRHRASKKLSVGEG